MTVARRRRVEPLKVHALPSAGYFARHGGPVLTFGTFDGVHRGHQRILRRVTERAQRLGAPSAAIVFRPRPIDTFELRPPKPYLTARDETRRLIKAAGIRHVGVLTFDRDLASTTALAFLTRLTSRVPIRELVLGETASVGRGPEGSLASVERIGYELGFTLDVLPVDDASSQNRAMAGFRAKDLDAVRDSLGRPHKLPCCVTRASRLSKELGVFDLVTPRLLFVPPDGEYAVDVRPATFRGAGPARPMRPDRAVAIVSTARTPGSRPDVSLIARMSSVGLGSVLNLHFVACHAPGAEALYEWARGAA
jgi:FAD synthase